MLNIIIAILALIGGACTGGKIALYMLKNEMLPGFEYLSDFVK